MSIHVGEVSSTVEVAPPGVPPDSPGGHAERPLAPAWRELERHRTMCDIEAESRARTEGAGFDA
jgi:hypothetical protein